jgi:hypothetical protein
MNNSQHIERPASGKALTVPKSPAKEVDMKMEEEDVVSSSGDILNNAESKPMSKSGRRGSAGAVKELDGENETIAVTNHGKNNNPPT